MKQLNRLILGVLALIFVLYGVRYSLDRGMGGQGSQTVVFYNCLLYTSDAADDAPRV